MPCVSPIDAWRAARVNESGKRGITFRLQEAYTDMPLQVPCGKCIGCLKDRARDWSTRIYNESTLHKQNAFLTLTYAENRDTLSKHDLQCFFKRLRKLYSLRYFAVGEYGERTHRPHYHAIIFGHDFLAGAIPINSELYSSPILESIWGKGIVSVGAVTPQSCAYVAGYCEKKIGDSDTFHLMSRRPGIGKKWSESYTSDMRRTECIVVNGQERPVPKRYMTWHENQLETLKQKRAEFYANQSPEQRWKARTGMRGKETNIRARSMLKGKPVI